MKSFRKYLFAINIFLLSTLSTGLVMSHYGINNDSICLSNPEITANCCCCSDNSESCCCCNADTVEGDMQKCICNIESQNSNTEETPINATIIKNINFELLFSIINNQNTCTINSEEKANLNKSGINSLTSTSNLYIKNSNFRI